MGDRSYQGRNALKQQRDNVYANVHTNQAHQGADKHMGQQSWIRPPRVTCDVWTLLILAVLFAWWLCMVALELAHIASVINCGVVQAGAC